jgi:hypothetical protein
MNKHDEAIVNGSINLLAPNLSPNEFLKAKSMMSQEQQIINHCKDGSVKLTQQIIDMEGGIIFPVFSSDNLESIVNRYLKLYPVEASLLVEEVSERVKSNEYGFSKDGNMKFKVSIPATIIAAGKALSRDFWEVNNGKKINDFIVLCPKLASKNKR